MSTFEIVMPKLGESIIEATITRWLKMPGDKINEDDSLLEIATDKVDSEIPSPVEGILKEILYKEGEVVAVGKVIAIIAMEGEETAPESKPATTKTDNETEKTVQSIQAETIATTATQEETTLSGRFYSPLIKNIAKLENIPLKELENIPGSGAEGRLTKADLMNYLQNMEKATAVTPAKTVIPQTTIVALPVTSSAGDTIVEMNRMRRLIADHMVMSVKVSPHVTSFHEVDVTNIVLWRNRIKDEYLKKEGEKLTFTPLFVEAAAKTLRDYPGVNASVDGYNIILHKHINVGIATALPNGNLIVPVIKNADQKNLLGLVKEVNSLANNARNNKLNPDDTQGGTFTITNFGTFGNITGTPIINQPQVAILGLGAIQKKPVVLETQQGDVIAIRHRVILSLSYDHRVVDGALGGMFLKRIAKYLEGFDINMNI